MPVFAVAIAVPLSASAVKLARMPSLGRRYLGSEEPIDPASIRVDERMASDQERQGRLWSSELRERLDRPLGEQAEPRAPEAPALRQGVLAPAMLLLFRRWLNIQ